MKIIFHKNNTQACSKECLRHKPDSVSSALGGYIYHLSMLPTNELRIEARRAVIHYVALQLLRFAFNSDITTREA